MKPFRIVRLSALALTGSALVLSGLPLLGAMEARADDAVIAKLNGKEIRESDLALAEAEVGPEVAHMPAANRRRLLLEFVLEMKLFAEAADKAGLASGADYDARLAYWTTRAKRDAFYEKEVKGKVSDALVKGIYDDKVKMIPPEDEVEARHILVESEEKAKEVLEKVNKGDDFAKLAAEYSTDPGSKADGGKLGYFSKGMMVKEFEDAAFALKKGEVSKPVKSKFGWHVIKVEDRRVKPLPTFEEVKGQIVNSMVQQNGQQVATDLRSKAQIEYVDNEMKLQVEQEAAAAAAKKKVFEQQMDEQIKKKEALDAIQKEQK
ncbi:peptidylprolyl isomerase [Hyphomicrobium sp.]|uniref:peptidylprolyl isomerase n=1 Tax=Hyphomicrobium sp. TaxID=82 RepID=UPI002E34FF4F|nr:peptidylprolyl isomerase [Hyphomicrobium sp.]HEX2841935.1 peptidylprolyl isomerase [Hyphomicrobium sp.]